jgi:hypothetical protein
MTITDVSLISAVRNGFSRKEGRNVEELCCMMYWKVENSREVGQVLIIYVKSVVCT